jgi:pre-mRNA-splicing factor SYF2
MSDTTPNGDVKIESNQDETPQNLSEREMKLFQLRLRMNQSRKLNLDAVVKEQQQESLQPKSKSYVSKRKQREDAQSFTQTAETAEKLELKKLKKEENKNLDGWKSKTSESYVKSHDKRTDNVPYSKEECDLTKQQFEQDELNYGANSVPEQNKNRMVRELKEKNEKKSKYSRKRSGNDKDVTYINGGNKKYNKSLGKAYDKYSEELRQNIERGSAL